ncbi:hypothetical protein PIIN_11003 [Serendipita indica DSM 11827]|uniref:Uncharacterized protein n=1 Tax=Serendipita indica (strain DSM 11827) TaxID=1109443 RepID=G4U0C5_SERID|nr:hypothetical protein PIIN_11003 [Serendipita indica DSM 11827]
MARPSGLQPRAAEAKSMAKKPTRILKELGEEEKKEEKKEEKETPFQMNPRHLPTALGERIVRAKLVSTIPIPSGEATLLSLQYTSTMLTTQPYQT